jgi:hypothetical protein
MNMPADVVVQLSDKEPIIMLSCLAGIGSYLMVEGGGRDCLWLYVEFSHADEHDGHTALLSYVRAVD